MCADLLDPYDRIVHTIWGVGAWDTEGKTSHVIRLTQKAGSDFVTILWYMYLHVPHFNMNHVSIRILGLAIPY